MTILRYMMIKVQCLPAFLMWQFSDIWWLFFVQLTVSSRETCFNWSQRRFWCWTRFGRKYDQECVLMDWQVPLLWSNMLWLVCEFTVGVSSYRWIDCWRKTSWQPEMSWISHVNRARTETCCVEEKYMTEKLFWCLLQRSEKKKHQHAITWKILIVASFLNVPSTQTHFEVRLQTTMQFFFTSQCT